MTNSRISVLVPTRGRLDRLSTMLESYDQTTMGCSSASEIIFRIDDDDRATMDFLVTHHRRVLIGPRYQGYGSMPVFYNELAKAATGDVMMSANDDFIFRTPHWSEILLRKANDSPDGLFNLGVTTLNADHYPFGIVSRTAVDAMGFYWDPRIFWGDIFLRDVFRALGRCVMVPDVQIDHDWAGNRPDQTFLETRQSKSLIEGSSTYWNNVHAPAVNDAVEKLKALVTV